ncbi:MAG: PAS domain S-box protein, partial [Sediminispirochaetaceae bacterium]
MPHRILLVEDEAILALAEARTIQKYGYQVVTAYKGREAIELVESDPDISLILMDIDLGRGMDGTETAQRILETHDLPIAFLSSHTEPAIVEKTEGITSYGYIVKNSGETVLIASIKMAFRLYEAHIALKAQKENLRTALVQQEQAEEELLKTTEELDRYFTSSLDMLCIADTNGTLIRLNPEWETVLGYPISELEGQSFIDLVHPDDREATLQTVEKLKQQEEVLSFENRYRCSDGSYRWIEWRSRPMGSQIYAAARDITDRKRMEDDLRSSEEKFRSLMDQSADQLYLHDLGGNIIEVNESAVARTGYCREELLSMKISDLDPDYVDREDRGLFWKQLELHQPLRFEGRHRNKAGNIYQVEVVLTKIRIKSNIYIMALSRDITERKTKEEHIKSRMQDLSTSAARYRSLFYESPLGAIEFNTKGVITECNDSFIAISGASRERLIGFNLLTELQDRELSAQVKKALNEGAGFYEGKYTSVTGNKQSYLRIFFKGIRDKAGVISSCLCLVEDISEQKKVENELREKTELLRKITDNMFDMIAVTDMQGNFTFLGRSHEILGYELDFLIGRNVLDFVHPDELPAIRAAFQEFLERQEKNRTVQYRYRCAGGSYIWLE